MLVLREFGINDPSSNFSLCEVSVQDQGFVKTKRLPDQMTGLPDKIPLNARSVLLFMTLVPGTCYLEKQI